MKIRMNHSDDDANATTFLILKDSCPANWSTYLPVDIYNIDSDLIVDEIYRGPTAITRAFVRSDVAAESTARYQGTSAALPSFPSPST